MSLEFHEVMDVVVKTVNFIKNIYILLYTVNSRCFSQLCKSMEVDYVQQLYHSFVRWLSRGLVLSHLFELRNKVYCLLTEKNITTGTPLCRFEVPV